MTVEWGTVYARLLEQGLLVMGADVRQQIMDHPDPLGLVAAAPAAGITGLLNQSALTTLIEAYQTRTAPKSAPPTSGVERLLEQRPTDLARSVGRCSSLSLIHI